MAILHAFNSSHSLNFPTFLSFIFSFFFPLPFHSLPFILSIFLYSCLPFFHFLFFFLPLTTLPFTLSPFLLPLPLSPPFLPLLFPSTPFPSFCNRWNRLFWQDCKNETPNWPLFFLLPFVQVNIFPLLLNCFLYYLYCTVYSRRGLTPELYKDYITRGVLHSEVSRYEPRQSNNSLTLRVPGRGWSWPQQDPIPLVCGM